MSRRVPVEVFEPHARSRLWIPDVDGTFESLMQFLVDVGSTLRPATVQINSSKILFNQISHNNYLSESELKLFNVLYVKVLTIAPPS